MLEAIFARIRRLLLTPKDEWAAIERESANTNELYTGHVIPLALIPAIATFIGTSVIGDSLFGSVLRVPITTGLAGMIVGFALTLASVYAMAHVIAGLAPKFGAEANFNKALKVAAYFPTPAWLAGAFIAIPAVGVLSVLGALYALYLLFIGLPIVMQAPEEKAGDFALAAIGVASVIFIALALVAGAMTPRF